MGQECCRTDFLWIPVANLARKEILSVAEKYDLSVRHGSLTAVLMHGPCLHTRPNNFERGTSGLSLLQSDDGPNLHRVAT